MMKLSSTRIDTFAQCPQRYYYRYVEGLEPKTTAPELTLGRLWHKALEAYYGCSVPTERLRAASQALSDAWEKQVNDLGNAVPLWDEDYQRMQDALRLLQGMLVHYDEYWSEMDRDTIVLGTEKHFCVPIHKPGGKRAVARFAGVIDLVERDEKSGGVIIWEHKTTSSFDANWFTQNSLDRQLRRYAWAYERLTGERVTAVCINAARKKVPVNKVLKDGKLSHDKTQDTTYWHFLEELHERNLDPVDYSDVLDHLKQKGNTFFQRDTIHLNRAEIEEAGEELYWLYRRITAKFPPLKTPSPLCTRLRPCPYRVLCLEDTPEARMAFVRRGEGGLIRVNDRNT